MRWLTRDIRKVGIAIAGILLLLAFTVCAPVLTAGAHERVLGLATPGTVTVQATPTEDATVTALNKEKLTQEVAQQHHTWENWLWGNASALLIVLGGLFGLWRWLGDRRSERKKRVEERLKERFEQLSSIVADLGDEKENARLGAAVLLRVFLNQDGSEQFYIQIFDLVAANLRIRHTDPNTPAPLDPNDDVPINSLSHALIAVFKEVFPLAREWIKKRQTLEPSFIQKIKARFKRRLPEEGPFNPQLLDASRIRLDNAYLRGADLEDIWMRDAFLIGAELRQAKLSRAYLTDANLSHANLRHAFLCGAGLHHANLCHAHLREAHLNKAYLKWADFDGADLNGADLREADFDGGALLNGAKLREADLRGVKGLTKEQLEACKAKGAIIDEDSTTNPSQSTVAPPPPTQSNDVQAQAALPAQGGAPTPDTGGSTASSKLGPES